VDLDRPERLLLLLAVAGLAAAYVVQQARRRRLQRRWADDALLSSVAPSRPGPLRHLPAALVALSLVAMTVAVADPRVERQVEQRRTTVVVALDTSTSMLAQDVAPNRFDAARQAASQFVEQLPADVDVALVSFAATASLQVPPTSDRAAVTRAIAGLDLDGGTALGDAVLVSLAALGPPREGAGAPGSSGRAVVLLADGGSTAGSPLPDAVQQAVAQGVPVSTIAYGTAEGVVISGDVSIPVPVDRPVLAEIAAATGGQAYTAASSGDLADVLTQVGGRLSRTTERQDVSAALAGVALALLVAASVSALAGRLRAAAPRR